MGKEINDILSNTSDLNLLHDQRNWILDIVEICLSLYYIMQICFG